MPYELRASGVDLALVEPGIFATKIVNVMATPDDTARAVTYDAGATKNMQAMGEHAIDCGKCTGRRGCNY